MNSNRKPATEPQPTGLAALLGWRRSAPINPAPMRIEQLSLARGHAGKTALIRSMRSAMQDNLPSGLQLGNQDPLAIASLIHDTRITKQLLSTQGLPQTIEMTQTSLDLCEGETTRSVLLMQDIIGQVLTHTMVDSSAEQKAKQAALVHEASQKHVLWLVLSPPPRDFTPSDLDRYGDDLLLTTGYLRAVLRERRLQSPAAVALVVAKIDTISDSEAQARGELSDEQLTKILAPLVSLVRSSDRVGASAIFPVSSFGFQTAMSKDGDDAPPRPGSGGQEDGEIEWILKPGAVQQPFNLTPLLVWSLLTGLLYQDVAVDGGEPDMARICRLLADDLDALGGWIVPLKGPALKSTR